MAFQELQVLNTNLYKNKKVLSIVFYRIHTDSLLLVVTDLMKITNLSLLTIFPGNWHLKNQLYSGVINIEETHLKKNLLNLLLWHWLIKLYRFQVYNSIIHYLYIVLCVHYPKSSLLPSLFIPTFTLFCLPTPSFPSCNHHIVVCSRQ